jgi:acetyl esterase/lipase
MTSMEPHAYGSQYGQTGDLHLPDRKNAAVVCLLHGGFWKMPHGRGQMTPIANDLAARGFAVWNPGYRRIGATGGGWPGTFADIGWGIDHLATLAAQGAPLDLDRVIVVGHSAGGHLALWASLRDPLRDSHHGPQLVRVKAVVGLAPVSDLAQAHDLGLGDGAVEKLLGGSPATQPARYRMASPIEMLPLDVCQLIVHGRLDDAVPVEMSRRYVQAALAAGDEVRLLELEHAGHMDFLDPASQAHSVLCEWLNGQ